MIPTPIKHFLFIFSFFGLMPLAQAQQQGYKALLDRFYHHSENNFKDIIGEQIDTLSTFYPSKLKADIGEVKIGKTSYAVTLNWSIPLAQSAEMQAAAKSFIRTAYFDAKLYKIVSDGTEEEGYITTNVYALRSEKPLLVFQTIYYRNSEVAEKSNFTIIMYGK